MQRSVTGRLSAPECSRNCAASTVQSEVPACSAWTHCCVQMTQSAVLVAAGSHSGACLQRMEALLCPDDTISSAGCCRLSLRCLPAAHAGSTVCTQRNQAWWHPEQGAWCDWSQLRGPCPSCKDLRRNQDLVGGHISLGFKSSDGLQACPASQVGRKASLTSKCRQTTSI